MSEIKVGDWIEFDDENCCCIGPAQKEWPKAYKVLEVNERTIQLDVDWQKESGYCIPITSTTKLCPINIEWNMEQNRFRAVLIYHDGEIRSATYMKKHGSLSGHTEVCDVLREHKEEINNVFRSARNP